MTRLLLIVCVIVFIAAMSPTRESREATVEVGAVLGAAETWGAVASSPAGRKLIDETVRGEAVARLTPPARPAPPSRELR